MPDGGDRFALLGEPPRRPQVHIGNDAWPVPRQPMQQQFPQQRVDTEPLRPARQVHHQRVARRQSLQGQLAVTTAGQLIRQTGSEPVGHAGHQEELPVLLGKLVGDLFDQVFGHQMVAAGEPGDAAVDVTRIQTHQGQPQARGPPLGAVQQHRELTFGQAKAIAGEQLRRLGRAESQVMRADIGDFTVDPQPVQPQRRIRPGGQHQAQLGRLMIQQLTERFQHRRVGDLLEIVQHQHKHLRQFGQRLPDLGELPGAEPRGGGHMPERAVGGNDVDHRERTQHVGPERLHVVICFVHRQPCHRAGSPAPAGPRTPG